MAKKQKNRKAILVILLALAVAVTGAFIGSLAKYAVLDEDSDEAVAAKFGLNIPNTIDLFSESYTNVESDTEGKKVIAPGTEGYYNFEVVGTSEVAYKVSAVVDVTYSEEWDDYAPLEFSVNGETWTKLDAFKTNLSAALESKILPPNTEYNSTQAIHWRWPFYVSPEYDVKDTAIGVEAATGTAPKVTVEIEVTAAQVD